MSAAIDDCFTRYSHVGRTANGDFYVAIKWSVVDWQNNIRLSINGFEGDGDRQRSGQTGVPEIIDYAEGWDAESAIKLAEIWDRWHLNDHRHEVVPDEILEWLKRLPNTRGTK